MLDQRHDHEPLTRDVTSRGARLRFSVYGEGPPIVLVHDFLSSGLSWSDMIPHLAKQLQVIVPDLPGFGESEKPPPEKYAYGPASFAESIMDLTAAIGIERFVLCGQGLGGAVGLTAAADHPSRVSRLIAINPIVYASGLEPLFRLAALPIVGPVAFKQLLGRRFFRRHMASGIGQASLHSDELALHLFDQFNSPAAREAAYATMTSIADPRTISASLPRIHAPTLVVWERSRRSQPIEYGRRLTRELAQSRLHVLDRESSPEQASPESFASEIVRFVRAKSFP